VKVKFTGSFASLKRFQKKVEAAPKALLIVNEQLAEETIELIREGFQGSKDPYGNAWAPLVLRDGRPLEDTGGLKAAWHRQSVSARGFVVANAKRYASFHQGGTGLYGPRHQRIVPIKAKVLRLGKTGMVARSVRGSPARKMVPDRGRLPAAWKRRFEDTAQEVFTELFR
jgi:phage gpG-like protein